MISSSVNDDDDLGVDSTAYYKQLSEVNQGCMMRQKIYKSLFTTRVDKHKKQKQIIYTISWVEYTELHHAIDIIISV